MQILKFGGTSVANAANMNKVVDIVLHAIKEDRTVVVASAVSGFTDKLIEIGRLAADSDLKYETILEELRQRHFTLIKELLPEDFQKEITEEIDQLFTELHAICKGVYRIKELSFHTLDLIMSFGELCSTKILNAKFVSLGIGSKWLDSRQIIKTYYALSQNLVDTESTNKNACEALEKGHTRLYIMPGFIASDASGRTTTLGRGGSDYTASLLAAAVTARRLEIWTDVCGMMTADPRIVPEARTIEHISYREALELSHFGAKVVYPPTIQPVIGKGVPILVKNTFDPDGKGTLIELNPPEGKTNIKGISSSNKLAILSMEGSGMVGIPGYSSRLFDVLTKNEINIILITQASSVHTMLVAIDEKDAAKAKSAVDELFAYEISLGKLEPLKVEQGYSILSLVGDNMKSQSGASGRMFEALGKEGIEIRAIAQGSSERNVSAVISTSDVNAAIKAIHKEFFSDNISKKHLFIAGYGNVGSELVDIIKQRRSELASQGVEIDINGICNSRNRIIRKSGIDISLIPSLLSGEGDDVKKADISEFIEEAIDLHLPNSIFVDCTSDRIIAGLYPEILKAGIGIATCNKIANSSEMELYNRIRRSSAAGGASFLYDTNVGAALPILRTLRQMKASGDHINSVEAIVSGTLNYIFSEYCTPGCTRTFGEIVREAKELGYSEPDPRTDLGGVDVLRKAVIMAREIGIPVEPSDVDAEGFLPSECLEGDVNSFFSSLEKNEPYFESLRADAAAEGAILRYVARIESPDGGDPKVSVGLKKIGSDHPFHPFTGTDSAIMIDTVLYPSPVVIKGAGAGGRITAGGVFTNILNI